LLTKNPDSTRRAVVKQETKGLKSEMVKCEDGILIKREQAQYSGEEVDPTEYEQQFEVMAMGIVADELPQTCVELFL
jgi:hypothetical protein